MSVEDLSRIQFALTISFHFLFPPLTIGLGVVLVIFQVLRVRAASPVYTDLARFWTRVFGLIFAIGVVTGIPMELQFGMNWSRYARFVGDVFGSPLAVEGIYAFFLESGFLALLLFGWDRVGPRVHLLATAMVTLGAHFSAVWILIANSWMQTPAGYRLARMTGSAEAPLPDGYVVRPEDLPQVRAVVTSFREVMLNPSALDRLTHTILACWVTGAFLVVGVSAWWLLRGRHRDAAVASLKVGLSVATVACLLQMVAGDATARGVARNQPTKLAAIEGLAATDARAGLSLVGLVRWKRDADGEIVGIDDNAIRVPGLLSVLVSGDVLNPRLASATVVQGLDQLPSDEFLRRRHPGVDGAQLAMLRPRYWPNVPVVFQTYHLMVALGVAMTGLAVAGCALWWSGRLWDGGSRVARIVLMLLVTTPVMAQVATQAGWFTAEMGRQPWIVYEVLLTADAASAVVRASQVFSSIALFVMVYLLLTVLFLSLLARLIAAGPTRRTPTDAEPLPWT